VLNQLLTEAARYVDLSLEDGLAGPQDNAISTAPAQLSAPINCLEIQIDKG
jgi:hypothetical protein